MAYAAIPVTHAGFSAWQLDAMEKALGDAEGKILAFCRSGARSTLLWALTRARAGDNCDKLSATAAKAGYDLSSIRPMMDALSAGRGLPRRSEEQTSELQSLMRISYDVFSLKKKTK